MPPPDRPRTLPVLLTALLAVLSAGCATIRTADAPRAIGGPQSDCDPVFPDRAGWYGGDAAYSVPLPAGEGRRSVWLFGDSFVRRPDGGDGRTYPFVHNSVGVSTCEPGGRFRLDPHWGVAESGDPHAFFEPDPDAEWARRAREAAPASAHPHYYWPLDGIVHDGALYVALLRVAEDAPNGPFNLPFRLAGVDLARIANPADPPSAWRIGIRTLADAGPAFPGTSFVADRKHLYAFAFVEAGGAEGGDAGGSPRILTRLPLRALTAWSTELGAALETWTVDGGWQPGLRVERAAILMADRASEMSVHFDPERGRWIAVYSDLDARPDGAALSVRIRHAPTLRGPWSPPADLVAIPETRAGHARANDPNLFCYAGKAHPQFSRPGDLAVTYVCNLYARDPARAFAILERLRDSPDLYRPKLLRVPTAGPGGASTGRREPTDRRPASER